MNKGYDWCEQHKTYALHTCAHKCPFCPMEKSSLIVLKYHILCYCEAFKELDQKEKEKTSK